MKELFEVEIIPRWNKDSKQCRHCAHAEKWECNTKYFFYCRARKSNRTANGLLKIKLKNESCESFKPLTTK